jgi:hypothetical protein
MHRGRRLGVYSVMVHMALASTEGERRPLEDTEVKSILNYPRSMRRR